MNTVKGILFLLLFLLIVGGMSTRADDELVNSINDPWVVESNGQVRAGMKVTNGDTTGFAELGITLASYISQSGYCRVLFNKDSLETIQLLNSVEVLVPPEKMYPQLNESMPYINVPSAWAAPNNLDGTDYIVGVVDSDIDPDHADFIGPTGNRILEFWDQTGTGSPPWPYTYGTIIYNYSAYNPTGSEHGCAVTGVAAGDGSSSSDGFKGAAYNANIILRQLQN